MAKQFVCDKKSLGYEDGPIAEKDAWVRFDIIDDELNIDAFGICELNVRQMRKVARWITKCADTIAVQKRRKRNETRKSQ